MKTFITCILFSVYCSISNAQNYVPFPTTNAVWRGENASWIHWPTFELYVLDYNQAIVGDTLLNGIIYHKIEETAIYNTYDNSSPNFPVLLSSVYFLQTYAEKP